MLYLFVFSYCSWGSWGKNTVVGCHFLLWWSTFVRTLHFDLSWIALLDMAHSFTELCKAHHHEKWPMKGGRGATHTTLPSRMAYEVFSKFFKYSESRWASSKKSLIFLLLLKIISATDLKKKIAEISVLYVLMENWVNNLSYWFKKKIAAISVLYVLMENWVCLVLQQLAFLSSYSLTITVWHSKS